MSRLSRQRRSKRNGGSARALIVGLGVIGLFGIIAAAAAAGWVVSIANSGPEPPTCCETPSAARTSQT
jgi:threonine dehydrogenase-like Zn-dependent dehydrogenase